ncbi:MAG TPA: universal stress protein [Acidimicrobiales bacterium]|nr:universal stress protein [Acidimicrobiales bacterium]
MFETILTALDGSEHDTKALVATAELAKLNEATVRIVHVREGDFVGRAGFIAREDNEGASALVDHAVATLVASGAKASGTVRSSLPNLVAREILDEAHDCGASVIVMGARGLSDLKGLLFGSNTHKVLHLGHLPVLIIR